MILAPSGQGWRLHCVRFDNVVWAAKSNSQKYNRSVDRLQPAKGLTNYPATNKLFYV